MLLEELNRLDGVNDTERMKLRIEIEKLRIERFKAWGTIAAILAPLVLATGTLMFNVVLQDRRARTEFELKAADIVMTATSPAAAASKAAALVELFPDRLPKHFSETLDNLYGSGSESARQ